MLVSIITPSYNQAKYLEQTIQSVLNQTYKNIEYIIIDGGSTDGSVEIIKKYAPQLAYWQSQPDGGQVKAINKGFSLAKGDIIAYLNSDDLLQPKAVETIIRAYEVNPEYAVYYGLCNTIDEAGNQLIEAKGNSINYNTLLKTGMLPRIFQPACFFNRTLIKRDFILDEKHELAFDYELLLYLIRQGSFMFLYSYVASYRQHNESKSATQKRAHYLDKLSVQKQYGKKHIPLWMWRKIKFEVAYKMGKV